MSCRVGEASLVVGWGWRHALYVGGDVMCCMLGGVMCCRVGGDAMGCSMRVAS